MKTDLFNFKGRKWEIYGAAGWPAYITPFAVVPSQEFFKMYGVQNEVIALWQGKTFDWFYDKSQLEKLAKKLLSLLIEEKWSFYRKWEKEAKKFRALHYQLMDLNLQGIDNRELQKWLEKYFQSFILQFAASNFIEPLSFYFQNNLKKLISKEGVKEVKALISSFAVPCKQNYIKECINEYKKGVPVKDLLKKYHFVNNDYTGSKPFKEKDLMTLKSDHLETSKENVSSLSQHAKDLLTVLQIITTTQDVRKAESLMWISGAEKLLKEFSKRRNIPLEELRLATWNEIIKNDFSNLNKRKNYCVVHWNYQGEKIYSENQSIKMISDFRNFITKDKDPNVFKGVSASSGKIRGKVVVVLNVSHFNKVKEGDILVTVMTRPEYLPVMRLASAFVTDEGGITCHAAIIAREMKKPCVIATRIASKILKDGDIVEVDADKGIVRKIK